MAGVFVKIVLCAVAALAGPCSANKFLRATPAARTMVDQSLFTELFTELADSFNKLADSFNNKSLDAAEKVIRPTYTALPKNQHGNLDRAGVRYALHRYFVKQYGWYMKGLRPADATGNVSGPNIMKERAPAYIQELFDHRLDGYGFGMHELTVFAATLEELVHQEAGRKVEAAYIAMGVDPAGQVKDPDILDIILDSYMIAYIMNVNVSKITPGKFMAAEKFVQWAHPTWPETKSWMRDLRLGMEHTERHRRNPFKDGFDFTETTQVVEAIGYGHGTFQAIECHDLKGVLVEKEYQGTGRVRLSDFYTKKEGVERDFSENVAYLRHLGALDETDPNRISLVIPNYVNSLTNCVASSSFYSVCCRDECADLFGHLEDQIAAPEASPERIAQLVAGLASDTVDAPRNLSTTLLSRLREIAGHHGGRVRLHGRLFAQWMHHAYPRECSFPLVGGATGSLNLQEWIRTYGKAGVTPEEMKMYTEAVSGGELNLTLEAAEEALPWTAVEELVVGRREPPSHASTVPSLKAAVFLAALVASAVLAWRAKDLSPETKVEHHFV